MPFLTGPFSAIITGMPKDQQSSLSLKISRSVLLSAELKHALTDALPKLTQEEAATLSALLKDEEPLLHSIITHAMHAAAQTNNGDFFEQLSHVLLSARTTMRKTEEHAETISSDERTSHLLD